MIKTNNLAVKALATFITLGIIGLFSFMGMSIDANDKTNTKDHVDIRRESGQGKDNIRKELMLKIESVQMEQKVMRKETNDGFINVLFAISEIKK